MSQNRLIALLALALMLLMATGLAAQETQKIFNLSRDESLGNDRDEEDLLESIFIPQIESGKIECGISLGMMNIGTTLFKHDQIIFEYTDELKYWGDTELKGKNAFNPIVRVAYNLTSWLAFEEVFSIAVSEYTQSVENTWAKENGNLDAQPQQNPELGEFTLESRSLLSLSNSTNIILYPFNINDEGMGRWHPYLSGGFSFNHLSLNSNYMDDASQSFGYNAGIGMRLIADELISIRFDVVYNHLPLDFQPSQYFAELNDGTLLINTAEFTTSGEGSTAVHEHILDSYENETLSFISYGVGFIASF